jgi:organic radical activating enzyme
LSAVPSNLPAAKIEIEPSCRDFASGLLLDLIAAIRQTRQGELIAFTTTADVIEELDRWSKLTGHTVIGSEPCPAGVRYVIRNGPVPDEREQPQPLGSRWWLYTNFDCNLACDYCCVRSSPRTSRRALDLDVVERIVKEASSLGAREFFLTGGEPFLLPNIAAIIRSCADAAPTTVLTNGMLFQSSRLDALRSLPRDRVTLQISLDSAEPPGHDLHRGAGSWNRAFRGIQLARSEGFRVRLAATVEDDAAERAFESFLDQERIPPQDRVIRRVALRGFAQQGLALARADLVPEPTVTASGVYWHPVGADDDDLCVRRELFPLAHALDEIRRVLQERAKHAADVASVFHCA